MKKILIVLLIGMSCFLITGCGKYDGKSLAWKIDNFTKGNSSSFINLTQSISENINALVNHSETLLVEEDTNERRKS